MGDKEDSGISHKGSMSSKRNSKKKLFIETTEKRDSEFNPVLYTSVIGCEFCGNMYFEFFFESFAPSRLSGVFQFINNRSSFIL